MLPGPISATSLRAVWGSLHAPLVPGPARQRPTVFPEFRRGDAPSSHPHSLRSPLSAAPGHTSCHAQPEPSGTPKWGRCAHSDGEARRLSSPPTLRRRSRFCPHRGRRSGRQLALRSGAVAHTFASRVAARAQAPRLIPSLVAARVQALRSIPSLCCSRSDAAAHSFALRCLRSGAAAHSALRCLRSGAVAHSFASLFALRRCSSLLRSSLLALRRCGSFHASLFCAEALQLILSLIAARAQALQLIPSLIAACAQALQLIPSLIAVCAQALQLIPSLFAVCAQALQLIPSLRCVCAQAPQLIPSLIAVRAQALQLAHSRFAVCAQALQPIPSLRFSLFALSRCSPSLPSSPHPAAERAPSPHVWAHFLSLSAARVVVEASHHSATFGGEQVSPPASFDPNTCR